MLRILDHILPGDSSDTIADVNHAAFVQAHGHLLSENALSKCTPEVFRSDWKNYPNPKCVYGYAYVGDTLVGFTVMSQCRHVGLEQHAEMRSLYVHPNHQKKGIGQALLQWGVERMRATANGKMVVQVVSANAARDFYLRTGAEHVVSHKRDVFGDVVDIDVLCYTIAKQQLA